MCLFFGNLVQQCDHAECQIVQTIKSLNQQSLFNQVLNHHSNFERDRGVRNQAVPSISNLIEQPRDQPFFKVQEHEPPSMEYNCPGQPSNHDSNYRERIIRLQRELNDLKSLTYWMKGQLQKKGILP